MQTQSNVDVRGRAAEALLQSRSPEASKLVRQLLSTEREKAPSERDECLLDELDFYVTDDVLDRRELRRDPLTLHLALPTNLIR